MSETKVKLIKQKYNEFASHGLEQELELIKLVSTVAFDKMENDNKIYPLSTIENAEKYLRKNAEKIGATHVFGVEYQFAQPKDYAFRVHISGDAYKPKKDKNGAYR